MRQSVTSTASSTKIGFESLVDATPMTVLHVDDDPEFVDLTETFLEREDVGIDVSTATDPGAILERLDADPDGVDCVVSDYQMPEMSGIELLERVRERCPALPFILFTGKGSEEVAGRAISAGVTDYLQKARGTDQYTVLANRIVNSVRKTYAERHGEQLLSAVETASDGIALVDDDGQFAYVNPRFAETFGYDREALLGRHWEVLYPEDALERVYEEVLLEVPDDGTLREETTMVDADGSEIVVDHALSYTPDGLLVCNVVSISSPIDRNRLLTDVFDALDDLLFFFDETGTLQYWNDRVETVTGYGSDELSALTPREFVREADRERMNEYVWSSRETGHARVEVELRRADGETIPYEFISRRVLNDRENLIGRIGLGRDISERKRYEEEIERQNERLEGFAKVLSHDLRNPLAVAEANLGLFDATDDREYLAETEAALDRIDCLITDILELAQTGDPIDASDFETVDLADATERAWGMIRRGAGSLAVEETAAIRADASRLQQLLENLFRNAVEHGGDDVSVRVGRLPDGSGFFVADDGPGIAPDQRDAVFEAGHSTTTTGFGFGLSTVDQLVAAHGWTIRVAEAEDGGARFEVRGVEFEAAD